MGESIPLPKAYFVALFCEAILHGTSTTNIVMVILTVLMYGLSTTHISLSLKQNLIAFFDQKAADGGHTVFNKVNDPLVYSQIALEIVNDSIVCWRTWILWGRDYRIIIPQVLCIVGGIAAGSGLVHAFAMSPPGEEVFNQEITGWFGIFAGLTCIANLYAVAAISYKAWQGMKILRHLSGGVVIHGGRYYKTVLVIIESGLLYTVALIITITLFAYNNNGVYVITDMLGHLTGIYPTGIIVLVCLNMTFHDDVTRTEKMVSTMQCTPPRGFGSTANGSSYGTVLHFRKDGQVTSNATATTHTDFTSMTMSDSDYELGRRAPRPWAMQYDGSVREEHDLEGAGNTLSSSVKARELV
ncbi:hypothetical protein C8Q80DRAFT_1102089 [Daedaleopsis nitida]|nr:hypothetical protein C8Q80DRAFT_1102089 [Daedaleopsis nitida]